MSASPRRARPGRALVAGAGLALVLLVLLGIPTMLGMIERKLILFPGPPTADAPPAGSGIEEVWIPTAGGARLHAWFRAGEGCAVLMAHGNAGDLAGRGPQLLRLHRATGCSVLLFDYQGYGKSEGQPSLPGIVEDGRAAAAWLAERTEQPPDALILHGRSLGGAVACQIAARDGARALILVNTFSSLVDMAGARFPMLPARALLSEPLDSEHAVRRFSGPVLQAHAAEDEVVPYALGERLHRAIPGEKTWVRHEGLGHNVPLPASWDERVRTFVRELRGRAAPTGG